MKKIINILDNIVINFWIVFCVVIFGISIIVKAMYHIWDRPYFTQNTGLDIVLFIMATIVYMLIFIKKEKIEAKVKYWMLWIIFGTIGLLYIFWVPLKPFSDMQRVADGALYFAKFDIAGIKQSTYLQMITKNMKVSMFYGFLSIPLPQSAFSFKMINIILYLLIAQFMSLIAKNLGFKYPKMIFIIVATYMPLILYCNHIYFDLPTLFFCTIAVYFYTKEKNTINMILTALFLGFGSSLRVLAYLFVVAVCIDYIFKNGIELFKNKFKKLIVLIAFLLISFGIPKFCDYVVNENFRVENAEDESIWTLFCMGINEEKFGFMNGKVASGKKSFNDFYELLISRNVKQNVRLFGRKILWTWSQGTYQAQRYGFGEDRTVLEKYGYETPLTGVLMSDFSFLRKFINAFCRAQYMSLFFFMILGLLSIRKDKEAIDKYRMMVYLMFGTFLVLTFYEMKSRYVMHCVIPMILIAIEGIDNLISFSMKYKQYKPTEHDAG